MRIRAAASIVLGVGWSAAIVLVPCAVGFTACIDGEPSESGTTPSGTTAALSHDAARIDLQEHSKVVAEPRKDRFLVRAERSAFAIEVGCVCSQEHCSPVWVPRAIGCALGELTATDVFIEEERSDEEVADQDFLEILPPGEIRRCEASPELVERRDALTSYLMSETAGLTESSGTGAVNLRYRDFGMRMEGPLSQLPAVARDVAVPGRRQLASCDCNGWGGCVDKEVCFTQCAGDECGPRICFMTCGADLCWGDCVVHS